MLTHSHTTQNNTPMQNFPQYNYYSFLLTGEKHSVDLHRKWAATHREAKQSAGKQGQGTQPQHLRKERKPTEQNKQTKQSHPLNAQRTRKQYYKINSALWSTVCRSCLLLVNPSLQWTKQCPLSLLQPGPTAAALSTGTEGCLPLPSGASPRGERPTLSGHQPSCRFLLHSRGYWAS